MFASKQPVFLGEAYKFSPNPLHKSSFPAYVPRNVQTHEKHIERVPYPYQNMRFDHLRTFYIPHTKLDHPYAKHLKIDPIRQEHETTEVEHLGIKAEMLTGSRPNEAKPEMGLGEKEGVKEFAIKNLQEAKGTENTLTRHRDEATYEGISTLPFEEQYKKFLNEKTDLRDAETHNKPLDERIERVKKHPVISESDKKEITEKVSKLKKAENPITNRKKTVVKPIVAPVLSTTTAVPPTAPATRTTLSSISSASTPPPPPITTKSSSEPNTPVAGKRKKKLAGPNVEEKVETIEGHREGQELIELQMLSQEMKGKKKILAEYLSKLKQLGVKVLDDTDFKEIKKAIGIEIKRRK